MAKQTINLGTSANKGDGDPLRTAFDKVNDNFDEVYSLLGAEGGDTDDVVAPMLVHNDHTNVTVTRDDDANKIIFSVDQAVTDLQGSVYADDSTLLVDGVNGLIPWSVIDGTPTDVSAFVNDLGYLTDLTGDLTGSVFADDSTLLVDGVNSKIVGDYENGTSTIGSTRVESYDIKALQDTNTTDLYVVNKIYGGETGTIKNVSIGSTAPSTSNGTSGDILGMIAFDSTYIYYCTANYTDGVADIWKRIAWSGDTW